MILHSRPIREGACHMGTTWREVVLGGVERRENLRATTLSMATSIRLLRHLRRPTRHGPRLIRAHAVAVRGSLGGSGTRLRFNLVLINDALWQTRGGQRGRQRGHRCVLIIDRLYV